MANKTGLNTICRQSANKVDECVTAVFAALRGTNGFNFVFSVDFTAEEVTEVFEKIPPIPQDAEYFFDNQSGFVIPPSIGTIAQGVSLNNYEAPVSQVIFANANQKEWTNRTSSITCTVSNPTTGEVVDQPGFFTDIDGSNVIAFFDPEITYNVFGMVNIGFSWEYINIDFGEIAQEKGYAVNLLLA